MAGLLSIALLIGWFFLARRLAKKMVDGLKSGLQKTVLAWLATVVLVVLPVTDEIIGGFQFRALCKEHAVLKVNEKKIKGKTIRVVIDPSNKDVDNAAVRIYYSHLSYRDTGTGEELASYSWYVAKGGLLVRTLANTDGITPLTIYPSSCSAELPSKYGFKLIN